MKLTRILALILAMLMLAMSFAACNTAPTEEPPAQDEPSGDQPSGDEPSGDEPPVDEPPADEQPPEDEKKENILNLVNTGVTEYVIVRDYNASQAVVDAINNVVKSIKEDTGADIEVRLCYIDRPDETSDVEAEKEILIGATNRAESEQALDGLLADDYTLQVVGQKLVVGGGGDSGTLKALAILLNKHIHEKGNKYMVKDGKFQSIAFSEKENEGARGTYSYSKFFMMGARIDSYYIFYPKAGEMAQIYKGFAEDAATHIATSTGYELEVYKDNRGWADYEILIGDTVRTPEGTYEELADDEYVIQLVPTEVEYEDGSTHAGAQLYICFGEDAYDAAMTAFTKQFMPISTVLLEKEITEAFILRGNA